MNESGRTCLGFYWMSNAQYYCDQQTKRIAYSLYASLIAINRSSSIPINSIIKSNVSFLIGNEGPINIHFPISSYPQPPDYCRKMGGFSRDIFINTGMIQESSMAIFIMIMGKRNKRTVQTQSCKGNPSLLMGDPRPMAKLITHQAQNQHLVSNGSCEGGSLDWPRAIRPAEHVQQDENAVNFQQLSQFKKQSVREQARESQEEGSMTLKFERVAVEADDCTKKDFNGKVHRAITKQLDRGSDETTRKGKKQRPPAELPLIHITSLPPQPSPALPLPSHNQEVEQILQSAPLRQRFKALLPTLQQYSLGFHHKQLLQVLRGLDSTMQFLSARHSPKWHFFTELATNIRANKNGMEVSLLHIQQLTFLDPSLYDLDKQFSNKIKQFDLRMRLPAVGSEDERVKGVKEKIIDYLLAKELQFLAERGRSKGSTTTWSEGFNPERIHIPARALPSDPPARGVEFQHMTPQQLQAVANPQLRSFMQSTKQVCEARSVTSMEVASLILGKKDVKAILNENFRIAQETNARRQQQARQEGGVPQKAILSKVCEEILMIYLAKSITNMFRKTLVDLLNSKLSTIKATILAQALEFITSSGVGFLQQRKTSSNDLVLQISRDRYNQMREKIQAQSK